MGLAALVSSGNTLLSDLVGSVVPGRLGLLASLCRGIEVPPAASVLLEDHEGLDVVEALAGAGFVLLETAHCGKPTCLRYI